LIFILIYFNYFSTSVQYIYILNITDEVTEETRLSLYSRELVKNYYKCHYYCWITNKTIMSVYSREFEKKNTTNVTTIVNTMIELQMVFYR
jgi:hypothetical protein